MNYRIAIVDDHRMMAQAIAGLIGAIEGCEVIITCHNGKELIEKLSVATILPDLILLDINMPLMNGWETASWVRENYPGIQMLCLTMNEDEMSIIKMFKSGVRGYLLKDADQEELYNGIQSVMQKGYYYTDHVAKVMINSFREERTGDSLEKGPIESLKEREVEFLHLCCSELSYKQIADVMHLSPKTIDGYREDLFQKLGVKSRIGLVLFAIKQGWFQP